MLEKKLLLLNFILAITGWLFCTTAVAQQPITQPIVQQNNMQAWYAVRFSIPWAVGQDPQWFISTLIAGELLVPILQQNRQKIAYWRAHRRAVRDEKGHQFSFIFYSTQADAAEIYQQFREYQLVAELQNQNLVAKVTYDSLLNNKLTDIADTSDPVWPEKIRKTWPLFIMGASEMWLAQIEGFKQEIAGEPDRQARYIKIQAEMTELWKQQGKHALLHHLSALYAYEAVLVRF